METHLAFVFSMWPRSQTEEIWVTDSLPGCGVRTREGASLGHQHVPPTPSLGKCTQAKRWHRGHPEDADTTPEGQGHAAHAL